MRGEVSEPYNEKKQTNLEKLKSIKTTKPNLLKNLLSRFDKIVG
jgi:hypothetical protein